jgi:beta-glucuronidase
VTNPRVVAGTWLRVCSLLRLVRRLLPALVAFACLAAAPSALAAGAPLYRDAPAGRVLLAGQWLFRADPADQGLSGGWAADTGTAGWAPVAVPNAWNATDVSDASMAGTVAWYRRDFHAPKEPAGARWLVRFESVNYRATVFLNGVEIGQHEGASIPFELELTNLQHGANHLAIRVDNRRGPTDLPPGPRGGWWNYGGLLREVYLRPVKDLDISEVVTRTAGRQELLVQAMLWNPGGGLRRGNLTTTVAGRTVDMGSVRVPSGRTRSISTRIDIPGARRWLPRKPVLYPVSVVASVRGRQVARYDLHTGLRAIAVAGDGRLTVDDRPAELRGAAVHEDNPDRGAALTPADRARQIALLRQLGATVTRAHYPLHPDFLERADRAGIFVWEQIPMYQLRESAMRNPAVQQKALDYLAATVRRDRNHPSVLAWSIGNELPATPQRGQTAYIKKAVPLVRRLDPTRPVALDLAGYPTKGYMPAYAPLDALGINDYFGWYHGPTGQILNRAALGQYLDRLHGFYPHKALFVTEFGAEANRSGASTEKGTFEFQSEFMRFHLATFSRRPFVSGAIAWILQDFRVRPGWEGGNPTPEPPYNQKGLVDQHGRRKPAFGPTARAYRKVRPLGARR